MTSVLNQFFLGSGALSAWLAFSIAYLMLRSFRTIRDDYLIGFPVGFSSLGLAYVFFDLSYAVALPEIAGWFFLLLGSCGFGFLAAAYFFKKRSAMQPSSGHTSRWTISLIVLAIVSLFVVASIPATLLPAYQMVESGFRIINIVFLGYIIYSLNQALRTETELSNVVLGFTFLSIDQYSLLLWSLDRGFVWSLFFAQLTRIAGLFIHLVFLVRRFQRL